MLYRRVENEDYENACNPDQQNPRACIVRAQLAGSLSKKRFPSQASRHAIGLEWTSTGSEGHYVTTPALNLGVAARQGRGQEGRAGKICGRGDGASWHYRHELARGRPVEYRNNHSKAGLHVLGRKTVAQRLRVVVHEDGHSVYRAR